MSTTPPSSDLLDSLLSQLETYKTNFLNQTSVAFSRLTPHGIIRLVIIVGAYCLLRPYLIKLGGRFQERDHARAMEIETEEAKKLREAEGMGRGGEAGSLKERVRIPEDTESEDEGEEEQQGRGWEGKGKGSGADWGKTARRRQRRVMRQLLEAEEKRRREEEEAGSDKEIEELLTG